jgi:hypothetical protein
MLPMPRKIGRESSSSYESSGSIVKLG